MFVLGELSSLNPISPGVMGCVYGTVDVLVVTTSTITPVPGIGSMLCTLDESAVLAALVVYNLTQAAALVDSFNNE